MPFATGGGASNITGAQVQDASLSVADFSAATIAALAPTAVTLVPEPNFYSTGAVTTPTLNVNTTMFVGQVVVKNNITANKVTFIAGGVTAAGTVKVALFSEDGATKIFEVTTATISVNFQVVTTALSAIALTPGIYYIAILPVSTTNITIPCYTPDTTNSVQLLKDSVTSEPIVEGTVTVTASTVPATITPASVTSATGRTLYFRLDN